MASPGLRDDGGMARPTRLFAAEMLGSAALVGLGLGAMVIAGDPRVTGEPIGRLGIAVVFGLTLAALSTALTAASGSPSGVHLNPAVTFAWWLARRRDTPGVLYAVVGQFVGAVLGAVVVWVVASGHAGFVATDGFGQLGWGGRSPEGYGVWAVLVAEVAATAFVVVVSLATGHRRFPPAAAGLGSGLALLVVMAVLLPVDNGGANPARAVASAVVAGTDAARQVWLFVLAPVIGAVVGVGAWLAVDDTRLEHTRLGNRATVTARDTADRLVDTVLDVVDAD